MKEMRREEKADCICMTSEEGEGWLEFGIWKWELLEFFG